MKTKNNYNIAALILTPICLLALVPLGSDLPGFLCIQKVVILFLCFVFFFNKNSVCSITKQLSLVI